MLEDPVQEGLEISNGLFLQVVVAAGAAAAHCWKAQIFCPSKGQAGNRVACCL